MFECVINIAEGRRLDVLDLLSAAAGGSLRDRHADGDHHRSVFTLINEKDDLQVDVSKFLRVAADTVSLVGHEGVHPRLGVIDVVPFVALVPGQVETAEELRDSTAQWMADALDVPVFLYGPLRDGSVRTLPEIRKNAFKSLRPDWGPSVPNPTLGASAVGVRDMLVAWNVNVDDIDLIRAKTVAAAIRAPGVRALAFRLSDGIQISCNLIDPLNVPPSAVYDDIARLVAPGNIRNSELVGLIPRALLEKEDPSRWDQLSLSEAQTIESRVGEISPPERDAQ